MTTKTKELVLTESEIQNIHKMLKSKDEKDHMLAIEVLKRYNNETNFYDIFKIVRDSTLKLKFWHDNFNEFFTKCMFYGTEKEYNETTLFNFNYLFIKFRERGNLEDFKRFVAEFSQRFTENLGDKFKGYKLKIELEEQ